MAYISTEQVKSIREQIKNAYPNYKWSISRRHHSTVVICLQESDLPIETHVQVNHFYIKEDKTLTTKSKLIFQHVMEICNSVERCYDRNFGNPYADYGNSSYFIDLDIGYWDKPHKTIAATGPRHPKARVGKVMSPADVAEYRQICETARAMPIRTWNHGSMKITEEAI